MNGITMHSILVSIAIPFFLLLIGLEYLIAKKKKLSYFNFNSSIVNICIGIGERLSELFFAGISYAVFDYIQKSYGLFKIESSIWVYAVLLIITDFVWYWYHRLSHEINLFWAAHIVHHQSEEFNYTVSARITIFQSMLRTLFWSVLPLLGFPAETVAIILLIHGLYPFFVHTRVIRKLGIFEKIFVTPSHHRVHHASNEHYLDKNYGSIFIIWDKIFNTFKVEKDEPVYGLTAQLKSHSFLWQHFHYYLELLETAKSEKGIQRKIRVFFSRPDTISYNIREKLEVKYLPSKMQPISSGRPVMKIYNLIQISAALILLVILSLYTSEVSTFIKISISMIILITLVNICAIVEQRKWITYLEYLRMITILLISVYYFNSIYIAYAAIILCAVILYYFSFLQKVFISFIYGSIFYNRMISKN